MTTIVATRQCMAADCKITHGSTKFSTTKIRRIGAALVAGAGDVPAILKFVKWLEAGDLDADPPKFGKDDELDVLVLTPLGLFLYGVDCSPQEISDPFYAIGSGADAALAAMHLGVDPGRAVEVACMVDNGSDGPVQVVSL